MVSLGQVKALFTVSGGPKAKVLKSKDSVSEINDKAKERLTDRKKKNAYNERQLKGGSTIKKKPK